MSEAQPVKARILVVDDEPAARSALTELLREENYEVHSASDGFKALGRLDEWEPDVIITDLKMPGLDGVGLLERVRERHPEVAVVVATAFGSVESAVQAVQLGADDYLTKPLQLPHLLVVLDRVLSHRALRRDVERMKKQLAAQKASDEAGVVGTSKPFRDLMALVEQVAGSDASVLLDGEPGTGKAEIARTLHERSARRDAPFVTFDCGAFSPELVEAELFGDVRAVESGMKSGRVFAAEGGSLFLDDVTRLPPVAQGKLLRILQERLCEPAGGNGGIPVNVRVIASSDRDLHAEVAAGRFREDLFYRLSVITLHVPNLRERREDIPVLATHFLRRFARKHGKTVLSLSERALGVLLAFDWPGNVTQLENTIERAVVLCRGQELTPRDLPRDVMTARRPTDEMPQVPGSTLRELERYAILRTLEHVGGSTSKAAKILGISPRKIQYRLNEYREADAAAARGRPSADEPSLRN
jgi:two-component system response regulator HydG